VSNVLDRPRPSSVRTAPDRDDVLGSVWLRGALAAGWAIAVGLASLVVLVLIVWAADSQSTASAGGAMRFAGQLWLLAHRSSVRTSAGGALVIPPLILTVLLGLLVARGAAILARTSGAVDAAALRRIVAAVTLPYAVLATILAAVTGSASLRPSVGAAFVCAALVGGISAALGAARAAGLLPAAWRAVPVDVRAALEAAGVAGVVVIAAATLLALGSLFVHLHRFGSIVGSYGGPGEFAMILLSLLYLPNAVCFAAAYISGPGFAIGAGTSVTYGGAHLGAMPSFPLLAAVPSGPAPWQVRAVFIAAMVAAAVLAGRRILRADGLELREQLQRALFAGAGFGLVAAVVVGFAGGPAGPGRLGAVGPSPWQVGFLTAAEISVVAAAYLCVDHLVQRWRGR
jgi:Family of unknown function (DUF6350)